MKILNNLKVPTGDILIVEGDKGKLELLSIGDYGKEANVKADFLGLTDEINGVNHTKLLPLEDKWVITISSQYGCSMGCHFCLPPDAPILMSDYTYKRVDNIRIGDEVISNIDPISNKNSPIKKYASKTTSLSQVNGLTKRLYDGDMYAIETKSGNKITCTENHPIAMEYKTRDLFESAKNIKIGDRLRVTNKIIDNIYDREWRLGWLWGFINGDGIYDEIDTKRWQMAQKHKYVLDFAIEILDENKINHTKIWTQGEGNTLCYRFAVQGKNIDDMMDLFIETKIFKIGYISGFWDAEGYSFRNNQIARVCTSNKDEAELFVKYSKDLNIKTKTTHIDKENRKRMYVINMEINRNNFISKFTPIHHKKIYLHKQKSNSFSFYDEVVSIVKYKYSGMVYNFETTEHSYYAYDILTHNCDVPKVGKGLNATHNDLINQVMTGISMHPEVEYTDRLNVHYARMGEPTWNHNVLSATEELADTLRDMNFGFHPVVSTMMPKNNKMLRFFLEEWMFIKNIILDGEAGLQLSINTTDDELRCKSMSNNTLKLKEISDVMNQVLNKSGVNGRKIALNFALTEAPIDADKLRELFDPKDFMCKITPMHMTNACKDNGLETKDGYNAYYPYKQAEEDLKNVGFDVLVFIPSEEEDEGRITCGNAILSGSLPECEYEIK